MTSTSVDVQGRSDVLVIGGGVLGVCCAYFLRESGRDVHLVDQEDIAAGSSYGNAGLIVPSHSVPLAQPGIVGQALRWMFNPESPFYIKPRLEIDLLTWLWRFRAASNARCRDKAMPVLRDLILTSRDLYRSFAAMDDMDFGFEERGVLYLFNTEDGLREGEHEAELVRTVGIETETLGKQEVDDRLGVNATVVGGINYPQDTHLTPASFVRALATRFQAMGGKFSPNTKVEGFEKDGRKIVGVRTSKGTLEADEVVLATGSWTPKFARELGIKAPIQAAKGYSITHRRPEGVPEIPVICAESRVAVTPMGDTLRFAGTLELAGLDLSINQRRVDAIRRGPPAYISEFETTSMELIEVWAGLRPVTPDGLSLLGRSPRYDNLTLAAGHAMIGMSSGPASAKLVTQVITGEEPFMDMSLMDPSRFG